MLLEVKNISREFSIERGILKKSSGKVLAVNNASFKVDEHTTLGIVGESGSGKTTLAKIILGLLPATGGELVFNKEIISDFRKDVQIIFQNPYNSLNPKLRVAEIIAEPLLIHKILPRNLIRERVAELLKLVGLDQSALSRLPREFSGGQRQRICIARALASKPKLIVLDEPISSLDLTIQVQMLDLFSSLKNKFNLTYIFISHNLAVIKYLADSVIVMYNGRIVEQAAAEKFFKNPASEYTRLLLQSATT